jgi:hypothetical protein
MRVLIRRMSVENPLWGAPRIHGELLKLGFEIAQRRDGWGAEISFGLKKTCTRADLLPDWGLAARRTLLSEEGAGARIVDRYGHRDRTHSANAQDSTHQRDHLRRITSEQA